MIQQLFDNYVFLYIMGGFCTLGILIKFLLFMGYRSFIKATDSVGTSKKRSIKQMKLKFETCYQLKIGVNNVDIFVDKYVMKRKFCGILLSTWENISGQMITLCLLTASCAGMLGIVYDCGKDIVLFTFLMGAGGGILMVFVDNLVNIDDHKKILQLNLKDYFENYLKIRLEREHFYPEELSRYRNEYFSSVSEGSLQTASAKEQINVENKIEIEKDSARSKREERHAKKLAKSEEKKAAKLAKSEEKKAAKRAKVEAKISAKLAKKEARVMAKHAKTEKKEAEKLAKKMVTKQKDEEARRKKAEILRMKEEKSLSQQKAYQYKMRLKEEKELEKKRQEEIIIQAQEEESAIPENAEDIIEELKKNIKKEPSSISENKTEEDKLIEEVLREFLA